MPSFPYIELSPSYVYFAIITSVTLLLFWWKTLLAFVSNPVLVLRDRIRGKNKAEFVGPSFSLAINGLLAGGPASEEILICNEEEEEKIRKNMGKLPGFSEQQEVVLPSSLLISSKDKEEKAFLSLDTVKKRTDEELSVAKADYSERGNFFRKSQLSNNNPLLERKIEDLKDTLSNHYIAACYLFRYNVPVSMEKIKSIQSHDTLHQKSISDLFRYVDLPTYFVLAKIQENISKNIKLLYALLYFVLFAFLGLSIFGAFSHVDLVGSIWPGADLQSGQDLFLSSLNRILLDLILFVACSLIMFLLYQIFYNPPQKANSQLLNRIAQQSLNRINDSYKDLRNSVTEAAIGGGIDSNQSRTFGGGEEEKVASVYLVNMNWITFRMFFMERYLQNIMYRILKHACYFLLFIPLILVASIFIVLREIELKVEYVSLVELFALSFFFVVLFAQSIHFMRRAITEDIAEHITEDAYAEFQKMETVVATMGIIQTWGRLVKQMMGLRGGDPNNRGV